MPFARGLQFSFMPAKRTINKSAIPRAILGPEFNDAPVGAPALELVNR